MAVTKQGLEDTSNILESRANGLGVSEVVFQVAGDRYILGEFPGLTNTEDVIAAIKQTGLLEFIDAGTTYLAPGTIVKTDYESTNGTTTPTESVPQQQNPQLLLRMLHLLHSILPKLFITQSWLALISNQ